MSQTPAPSVGNAFARVPFNFSAQKAAEFRAQLEADQGAQPAPADDPQPAPQPVPQPAPQPAPAQAGEQAAVQPVNPMPELPPLQPRQPQPAVDQQLLQQLQQERDAAAQEIQQLRQAVANLSQAQYQSDRQHVVDKALSPELLESLGTIDAEDARKLGGAMYDAMSAPLDELRSSMQQQRDAIAQQQQQMQQSAMYQQVARLNSEVERYHPDFQKILREPEFQKFLDERDGYSSETKNERAMREYQRGNSAYVIGLLYDYKGQRPNVQNAMSVVPSNAPSHVAAPASSQNGGTQYTLKELNDMYMMRQITPEQYKQELAKLKQVYAAQYSKQ